MKKVRFPTLTHLQFLVIGLLLDGEMSGRRLRQSLADEGLERTGPLFYQMMARLEDADLVDGWYDQKTIEDQAVKERHYRLSKRGKTAWQETLDFYLSRSKRQQENPNSSRRQDPVVTS